MQSARTAGPQSEQTLLLVASSMFNERVRPIHRQGTLRALVSIDIYFCISYKLCYNRKGPLCNHTSALYGIICYRDIKAQARLNIEWRSLIFFGADVPENMK